jgi:hypothetical protein
MRLFLKANWRAVLSSWRLGLGLIRTGRFVIRSEHIERQAELAAMLDSADSNNGSNKKREVA